MDKLTPISYENPERPTVSGRELHEFLGVKTLYKDWFPRMCEYGFTEGKDFNPLKNERVQDEGGRKVSRTVEDHQLTIPMAKELCMLQRNARGKQARRYFIAVEEQWNSPESVMQRAVLFANRKVEQLQTTNLQLLAENNELRQDAEYARQMCIGGGCRTITSIAKDYGLSAEKLNNLLHGLKIQYKTSDGQWVLYAEYAKKGYTKNRKSRPILHSNGRVVVNNTTVWTEAGQRFIYEKLKEIGSLPCAERNGRRPAKPKKPSAQQVKQITLEELEGEKMRSEKLPAWCVSVKKAMIDHNDMTVTELAKKTGYCRTHVSQVVNGVLAPSDTIKSAIEQCLDMDYMPY